MAKVNLWFIKETQLARKYYRLPPERMPTEDDGIWVPKSIIEHTSKNLNGHHVVELPDWFIQKENL